MSSPAGLSIPDGSEPSTSASSPQGSTASLAPAGTIHPLTNQGVLSSSQPDIYNAVAGVLCDDPVMNERLRRIAVVCIMSAIECCRAHFEWTIEHGEISDSADEFDGASGFVAEGDLLYGPIEEDTAIFPNNTTETEVLQLCCFENCINSLRYLSPALAYFLWTSGLHGEVDVQELHFEPHVNVPIVIRTPGKTHYMGRLHTIFKLQIGGVLGTDTMDTKGISLDPTYAQYRNPIGADEWFNYRRNCVASPIKKHNKFGSEYEEYRTMFVEEDKSTELSEDWVYLTEAIIRTQNNVLYRHFDEICSITPEEFERRVVASKAELGKELLAIRNKHDKITYVDDLTTTEMKIELRKMLEDSDGAGNEAFMIVFDDSWPREFDRK